MSDFARTRTLFASVLLSMAGGYTPAANAVLDLPDSPLFIGSSPQANILFAVDDSGSMDWEVLKSDGARAIAAYDGFSESHNIDRTPTDTDTDELLESCPGYNVMYYNPDVTYDPWTGEDNAGNAYADQPITAARVDPFFPFLGTVDLTTTDGGGDPSGYIPWDDADSDEFFDAGECGDTPGSLTVDYSRFIPVSSMTAAEKTNFANWYAYYRKREYVLKKVLSDLIDDSSDRIGLITLHDNDDVGTPVKDMTVAANKEALMDQMFDIRSSGGTPLRLALRRAGEYFDDTDGASAPSQLGFTDSSPILPAGEGGSCQQNFTILMSDGFWNGNDPGVGNEDADSTGNDTGWDGGPHADTYEDTLADVAMKFYEKDLSSLDDLVPEVEGKDSNTTQHMVTYTVSFGLAGSGLTDPADHDSATPAPPWTKPVKNTLTTTDDMQHAAFNARGIFLNAKDPQTLITSFTAAFADIALRTSFTATAVAINSTVLRTSSRLFTAQFDSGTYDGELSAFSLNSDGTLVEPAIWQATDNFPAEADRKIYTIVDKTGTPTAIEFADTDTDLLAAVGAAAGGGTSADTINYVRGDQSGEIQNGGALRDRDVILADIVKSSPVSSGGENFFYDILPGSEGTDYITFLTSKVSQFTDSGDPFSVVYVGTNGGTLHAFDSRDGSEIFAYVPQTVQGNLDQLTDPDYGHKFYVNASGFAADAYVNLNGGNAWHTLYSSGLGEGGRAIFTLDITDPLSPDTSTVLWEKDSTDYPELGHITFRPRIARLNNGDWGIIFGNGYNSDSERAQLFILDAEDGSLIAKIDTEVGDSTDTNGLGEVFLLDTNGDRIVDFIYGGDLLGNLWKFDVTSTSEGDWDSAYESSGDPEPLYTAEDDKGTGDTSDDTPQPITTRPILATHPDGGFMVMFGTGKYLEPSDNTIPDDPDVNTFYGIWDNGAAVGSGRTDLTEQIILDELNVLDENNNVVNRARIVSDNTVDYATKKGWFIDLLTPEEDPGTGFIANGEMVIADPLTRFSRAIFTTFIPGDTPCDQGGDSVIMELDAVSGARLQNSVFDFNNDGVIDASDLLSYGGGQVPGSGIFIPATLASPAVISAESADVEYKQSSGLDTSVTTTMESTGGLTVGRQSWRQLR